MGEHIFIARNNRQEGPFELSQIQAMVVGGQLSPESLCWYEGLPEWRQLADVFPSLISPQAAVPAPVASAAAGPSAGRVSIEIVESEFYQMPKLILENAEVVVEAGAMHYMRGNLTMEAAAPSVGGFIKSKLSGERAVRPRYRGTGELYLEPTFGECHVLELNNEEWILDRGAFLASEPGVELGVFSNKAMTGLFGGEGFFQTRVRGRGKVLILAPGPLERLELRNETLVVDGSFAVARTPELQYSVEKAARGLFASWISGEGIVNTFRGTGTVLIAPVPKRFLTLLREFGGVKALIHGISKG